MVDRQKLRDKTEQLAETMKGTPQEVEYKPMFCGLHLILTPVPAEIEGGNQTYYFVCGECHSAIDSKDRFCRQCGIEISWVGF